jgi:translation initiation factor 1A
MEHKRQPLTPEEEIARTRIPKEGEILGKVTELLGASKMRVECSDGKLRICRIPGKYKRRMWVRANDLVIVEPWSVQSHERGDIIWRYTATQSNYLKRSGKLKGFDIE